MAQNPKHLLAEGAETCQTNMKSVQNKALISLLESHSCCPVCTAVYTAIASIRPKVLQLYDSISSTPASKTNGTWSPYELAYSAAPRFVLFQQHHQNAWRMARNTLEIRGIAGKWLILLSLFLSFSLLYFFFFFKLISIIFWFLMLS